MSLSADSSPEANLADPVSPEGEEWLRVIFNRATDMMAVLRVEPGPQFRVISVNATYLNVVREYGFDVNLLDLVGKLADEVMLGVFHLPPEFVAGLMRNYAEAATTPCTLHYEEHVEVPGGAYYGETSLTPITDNAGRCTHILYCSHNVTGRKQADAKLRRLNRLYAVSNAINEAILRVRNMNELYRQACRIAVEEGLLSMAWVGLADAATGELRPVASWGRDEGYTASINLSTRDVPEGRGPGGRAFRSGTHAVTSDIEGDQNFWFRDEALKRNFRSCAAFALKIADIPTGILVMYADQPNYFDEEELELLDALAANLSFAIETAESNRQRQLAESALLASEERFRQLAENIEEVFWMLDVATRKFIYVSPAFERIWGRPVASLYESDHTWISSVHPDDFPRFMAVVQAPPSDNLEAMEYRIIRSDGQIRWIADHACPIRDSAGVIYRLAGVAQDITARKETENALRRSEERFKLVAKATNDAIREWDLVNNRVQWNDGFQTLFGYAVEELEPVIESWFSRIHPEDRDRINAALNELISNGNSAWSGEYRYRRRSGDYAHVYDRGFIVRDSAGRAVLMVAGMSDITEKKRLEIQFLRAQRMESIGTLAGGIAHDLNNALAPILMSVGLLQEITSDPVHLDLLATVESSAKRGAAMVRQVLTFARGVEGQRTVVAPELLVREVSKIAADTFPKSVKIESRTSPGLWTVMGDTTQLHQVLVNLCLNARDSMPHGGKLSIQAENRVLDKQYAAQTPSAQAGNYVAISVVDNGTGMSLEIKERLFEPFFTTKEVGKGTGLGLPTALAIVKSHGGFINVYSEPGRGSTFTVYLPVQNSPPVETPPREKDEAPTGRGELILVIDDEESICKCVRMTLESHGYNVLTACDGASGVSQYARHSRQVAAVITDIMMPLMDGYATIHALATINPGVRVLAASGLNHNPEAFAFVPPVVRYFLIKPYSMKNLLVSLRQVLDEDAATVATRTPPGAK